MNSAVIQTLHDNPLCDKVLIQDQYNNKPHGTSMPYIDTTKIVTLISHVIAYIIVHLPFWI